MAWSAWVIPDAEDAQGFLQVRELQGTDQRILTVRIDAQSTDENSAYPYPASYPSFIPATPQFGPGVAATDGDE